MTFSAHDRAEVLAGAITLGEATDEERVEYRRHLAACPVCLNAFGGEHELERLQRVVQDAAASEIWKPDVRAPLMDRLNTAPRRIARYGFGILGIALVISLIGHFVVGSSFAHAWTDPPVLNFAAGKLTLERRSTRDEKTPAPAPRMLVEHNIVHLPSVSAATAQKILTAAAKYAKPVTKRQDIAMAPPAPPQRTQSQDAVAKTNSDVPSWRSAIPPRKPAFVTAPSTLGVGHAESLTIATVYTTREAAPDGGDTAIQPRPPAIAASEGAEGTTAFEVAIDENGNPVKCTIAMSSGYPVLDVATCKAAMNIHYRPKTLSGKPVAGIYRDAFTFRAPDAEAPIKPL